MATDKHFRNEVLGVSAHFLDPFTFNNKIQVKNRVVMAPMTINASTSEGEITDHELAYYLMRSSGPGMVITAGAYVSSEGQAFKDGIAITKDKFVPGLKKLASVIKLQGAKAILQIYHGGRMAQSKYNLGRQPVGPSAVKATRPWAELPKELSETDIELIINQYGQAVRRAIEAGFDGVEFHGANTYLIQQFFSPHSNQRQDQWGGSLDNRLRFPIRVIEEARKIIDESQQVGDDFILGYRLSPEEIETPGIRLEDTLSFVDAIISAKIDYIHLSVKHYYQPSIVGIGNYHMNIPKIIYQHIDERVPMINVGNIQTSEDANKALEYSDLIALGRQLVVEPKWVEKYQSGQEKDIYTSISPHQQSELGIPEAFWQIIMNSPGWFPVKK